MRLRAYSALALCLALSACGSGSPIDLPAPPAVSRRCSQAVRPEPDRFWLRATDGTILDGAVLGSGEPGVVLVHGDPSDLCGELSTAQLLVSQGFRVLVFDLREFGLSKHPEGNEPNAGFRYGDDLEAAVNELRRRGTKRVFVLGESFGASVVQGSAWRSGADGAAAISGPPQIGVGTESTNDLDGFAGVAKLKVPLLVLISRGDHRRTPVDQMRRMVAGHGRLVVYPGDYHAGALLFDAPYRGRVRATLVSFLRAGS
jgi:pimeloyl-ACP methyl ester carboxylesterase